jgi:hypothetical protein
MRSRAYLRPEDYDAWSLCPGKPALEEGEDNDSMRVETPPKGGTWLDISTVTGEPGALSFVERINVTEVGDKAEIEITSPHNASFLWIVALAALIKYSLLLTVQKITFSAGATHVPPTLEELYIFGQAVTEAAAVSLRLRGDVAALDHTVAGDVQCRSCRARYRCPAYAKWVATIV